MIDNHLSYVGGPLADEVQPTGDPGLPDGLGIETAVAAPAQG